MLPLEYVDILLENDVGQIKTADNRILQEQLESKVSRLILVYHGVL